MNKKDEIYMVLLVDRQKAKMFTIIDGSAGKVEEIQDGNVPQKVKHGDDTWDAQNKIFRHIEDHLHRHLAMIAHNALIFAKKKRVTVLIIGSHKPLFSKIEKHIPYPLNRKIKGTFVTELKAPFNEILKRAKECIESIENGEEVKRYEKYFA